MECTWNYLDMNPIFTYFHWVVKNRYISVTSVYPNDPGDGGWSRGPRQRGRGCGTVPALRLRLSRVTSPFLQKSIRKEKNISSSDSSDRNCDFCAWLKLTKVIKRSLSSLIPTISKRFLLCQAAKLREEVAALEQEQAQHGGQWFAGFTGDTLWWSNIAMENHHI